MKNFDEFVNESYGLNEEIDFLVSGKVGGYTSDSSRWDYLIRAKNKTEAKKKFKNRIPNARGVVATPTSEYKYLDPYDGTFERLGESVNEGKYSSTRDADDIFFLWDDHIDDDRAGISHGNVTAPGNKKYSQFDFEYSPDQQDEFDDFAEDVIHLAKKKGWKIEFDEDQLRIMNESYGLNEKFSIRKEIDGLKKDIDFEAKKDGSYAEYTSIKKYLQDLAYDTPGLSDKQKEALLNVSSIDLDRLPGYVSKSDHFKGELNAIVKNWKNLSESLDEGRKTFKGTTAGDLEKAMKKDSAMVFANNEYYNVVANDMYNSSSDKAVYGTDEDGEEHEIAVVGIEFIEESNTANYAPPKYLVSPAVDPETQTPNDKMVSYMEDELNKRESYYKPGIRSANPPSKQDEVEHTLDDDKPE